MFEKASRTKLRFDTNRGNVTSEDLWDMPLLSTDGFSLDELARSIHKSIKESEGHSFVLKEESVDDDSVLRMDIVKRVIEVKIQEDNDNENAAKKKVQKERIMEILVDKEDEFLKEKTTEELRDLLGGM